MSELVPVHVWLPGKTEPVQAGTFEYDAELPKGEFRYSDEYLASGAPSLAPDMPLRRQALKLATGKAIFPLLLDTGPDTWGRHVLARRLGRDITEFEALALCPADGVGNLALGELTPDRMRLLTPEEFLTILSELEAGGAAQTELEERVLDAVNNGTSLGGTKPKFTLVQEGVQYLAKFPEPGDSRWLPHIECAMLQLARECGIRACAAKVWGLPDGRSALLVKRFDREAVAGGWARTAYVSAHSLLRLDMYPHRPEDGLAFATQGFTATGLRRSYVSFATDMSRWCGGRIVHLEERRELWRRIVFNALIRNLDDHSRNHGLLCHGYTPHVWKLAPAFDLVPGRSFPAKPALSMAYRYLPPSKKGRKAVTPRLVAVTDAEDLLLAAEEHYGYEIEEARTFLTQAAGTVAGRWNSLMEKTGMPASEIRKFQDTFEFARALSSI